MDDEPTSGGHPKTLGQCTECGGIYPVQETVDGELRPIGTEGGCDCGNATFAPLSE